MADDAIETERSNVVYKDHVHVRKALVAGLAILCVTALVMMGKVDASGGLASITGIAFYILGNGVAAYKGQDVQPVIRNNVRYGRRADD